MAEGEQRQFEEIEIPVPWGHISGKWWGPRNQEPVIAIHGWQDNAGSFDNLVPLLPEDMAVLCIDLPGHGHSSHLPQGAFYYIWWDNLLVLRRVVLHLKLKQVSLIGHSLGGGVGFLYAAIFPEEVNKLISIDIACPRVDSPETAVSISNTCITRFLKYDSMTTHSVPCQLWDEALDILHHGHNGSLSKESCEVLMRRGVHPSPSDSQAFYFSRDSRLKVAGLGSLSRDLVMSYACKITCEYLNIRADPGYKFSIPELYDQVMDVIKQNASRFEFHKINGTHHVHMEDAPAVANLIIPFLTTEKPIPMSHSHIDLVI